MKKRKTYHSTIKLAFALDLQKEWLPKDFIQSIPRSTYHAWKGEEKDKFIGHKFATQIDGDITKLKNQYHEKLTRERQLFFAYARLKITIINLISKPVIQFAFCEGFRTLVKTIESTKEAFGGKAKAICSFLDIKTQTYNYWKHISNFYCSNSVIGICAKRVPNQATLEEISTMKRLLNRKRFKQWPIAPV